MDVSKSLHPRIYEATDDWEARFYQFGQKSEEFNRTAARHHTIWLKTYGGTFLLRLGVDLGIAIGGPLALDALGAPDPIARVFAIAGLTGMVADMLLFVRRNRRTVSPEELKNLLPTLELSPLERVYCEAVIALAENREVPETGKQEIVAQLNRLLSAHVRLEEQRAGLLGAMGDLQARADLEAERDALRAKRQAATDAVALGALEKSLELCERRLENRTAVEPGLERLDAQAEMIRQTLLSLRESLARLRAAGPLASPDVEDIKRSVEGITAQTRSVEQAVEEVLQLRGS